jgi:hypothetical protein
VPVVVELEQGETIRLTPDRALEDPEFNWHLPELRHSLLEVAAVARPIHRLELVA